MSLCPVSSSSTGLAWTTSEADKDTLAGGKKNSEAWLMKLRYYVFNKVFLVNHWHDILIIVANGYVLVTLIDAYAPNHDFCFPLYVYYTFHVHFITT